MDYKILISIISCILVLVGYVPYIIDILKRKTIPHAFTFFIWAIAELIIWALQVHGGAGVGAWVTFVLFLVLTFVFLLSLKYGEKGITTSDIIFLILSLISLALWVVIDQPIWSIILIVLTDVLGFIPTIRKSWNKPYSETVFTWQMGTIRHGVSIFALQQFNILTLLFPVVWTLCNFLFSIFLIIRRKQIKP